MNCKGYYLRKKVTMRVTPKKEKILKPDYEIKRKIIAAFKSSIQVYNYQAL